MRATRSQPRTTSSSCGPHGRTFKTPLGHSRPASPLRRERTGHKAQRGSGMRRHRTRGAIGGSKNRHRHGRHAGRRKPRPGVVKPAGCGYGHGPEQHEHYHPATHSDDPGHVRRSASLGCGAGCGEGRAALERDWKQRLVSDHRLVLQVGPVREAAERGLRATGAPGC